MRRALVVVAALGLLAVAPAARADVSMQFIGLFTQPVYVTAPPGDTSRFFVVQQSGQIIDFHGADRTTFLDIASKVASGASTPERGLLSMAFAPDYASSGRFYVFYTAKSTGALTVAAYHRSADPDVADATPDGVVITIDHSANANHNGGLLLFGPDGHLYIGTGDGGGDTTTEHSNGNPQNPSSLLGKILRIDPNPSGTGHTNPAGSPFGNEVWAYGLRNPWRFAFDGTALIIGDVGQDSFEEVDDAPGGGGGANFGWNCFEADAVFNASCPPLSNHTPPVLSYPHAADACSIIGGVVVRDPGLPTVEGRYLYGDFCGGWIRSVDLGAPSDDRLEPITVGRLSSFGEDARGHVYAMSSASGQVWRLIDPSSGVPPVPPPRTVSTASSAPVPSTAAADTTAPALSLRSRKRTRVLRTRAVTVRARCGEACRVRARVFLRFPGHRPRSLGVRAVSIAHAGSVRLRWRLSAPTRRSIARALRRHRRVTARFSVTATDRAGNRSRARAMTVRIVG
jgi:glucose/arabinose dehydrogenase